MDGDELDAVTAALVGQFFLSGKAEVLGYFKRGPLSFLHQRDGVTLLATEFGKSSDG